MRARSPLAGRPAARTEGPHEPAADTLRRPVSHQSGRKRLPILPARAPGHQRPPATRGSARGADCHARPPAPASRPDFPVSKLPVPHLLLVDDDASVRGLVEEYLGANDFRVSGVADGSQLLASLRTQVFDLVLLDLRLPGEDGMQLL